MSSKNPKYSPFIYVATPWGPIGGGMYKVADYLIQAQISPRLPSPGIAELRGLDTRGNGSASMSMFYLAKALWRVAVGRLTGDLAGVHINMAERLSVLRKGILIALCKLLGVPVVLHLHAAQLPQFYQSLPTPLKPVLRWIFNLPQVCIVLGASARKFVIDELKVPADKVEIVINGVPEPTISRRHVASQKPQNVLFLGNLSERKGVSDLLKALAMPGFDAEKVKVTLAGGGDASGYEMQAKALGIEKLVHFAGWADQQKAARLMANADILILPSYDEGLPLVILEALANSVAVICTPVGEIPHVLTDDVNVCFVNPGDVPAIANKLQEILDQPLLREKLEKNAHAVYISKFSIIKFFDNLSDIHKRCFGVHAQR